MNTSALIARIKETILRAENSTKRLQEIKAEETKAIQNRLYAERIKFELRAQKLRGLEAARNEEQNKIINVKLEIAALHRESIALKAKNDRMMKVRIWISFD